MPRKTKNSSVPKPRKQRRKTLKTIAADKAGSKATAAAAKPSKKLAAVSVFHTTERYAKYGKHVDDTTTRKIELRHELEKHVATGKATLGSIVSLYGSGEAMLRIAKLAIRRIVDVAGVKNLPTVKNQSELWASGREWKAKLAALASAKPQTTVKMIGAVKHVSVMRKS